jgi:hypothetical protein
MNDEIAQQLLATVMSWHQPEQPDKISRYFPDLQLLAAYKYDGYHQFSHGRHFIESLALWLRQFDPADRQDALDFVRDNLIFVSDAEFFHLVNIAYPDVVVPERIRLVAEERGFPLYQIGKIVQHERFRELELKSLYLGLSDGARTSEFRRASGAEIRNDQIWQAYEIGKEKSKDLLDALKDSLKASKLPSEEPRFTLIWLLDDFTASGNTYIRFQNGEYKGKLPRVFESLHQSGLVDASHYEVFLLFYVATRQAVDHIEYWMERFTTSRRYKPLQVRVIQLLEPDIALTSSKATALQPLIDHPRYYDNNAETKATRVGGTDDVRRGFANCALPVVLCHNTPNNSIYLLWGEETFSFPGLFPRVSRHRDI